MCFRFGYFMNKCFPPQILCVRIKATNRKISSVSKILQCQHIRKVLISSLHENSTNLYFFECWTSLREGAKIFLCLWGDLGSFLKISFKKRERLFKTINIFIGIMLLPSFILTRFVMHSGLWSLSLKHCLLFHYSAIHLQITIHQNLFLATETMPFIWERTLFWQIK